jgi:hypothetical protein
MLRDRLSMGQIIAALAAAALLVTTFLDWTGAGGVGPSSVTVPGGGSVSVPGGGGVTYNLWEIPGSVLDVYLLITAVVALVPALLALTDSAEEFSFVSAATFVLGVVAVLLIVAFLTVDFPGHGAERKIGAWLGLAAAVGVAIGGFRSMQEEVAGEI